MRTLLLLITLSFFVTQLSAQAKGPLAELAGTTSQQWSVIGTSSPVSSACKAGEGLYTFRLKPAQVMVQQCKGGVWASRTEAVTTWTANGKSGIAFGGTSYVLKSLPATAPACKGNANCLRLASVPNGQTDATTTIYLTH